MGDNTLHIEKIQAFTRCFEQQNSTYDQDSVLAKDCQ